AAVGLEVGFRELFDVSVHKDGRDLTRAMVGRSGAGCGGVVDVGVGFEKPGAVGQFAATGFGGGDHDGIPGAGDLRQAAWGGVGMLDDIAVCTVVAYGVMPAIFEQRADQRRAL